MGVWALVCAPLALSNAYIAPNPAPGALRIGTDGHVYVGAGSNVVIGPDGNAGYVLGGVLWESRGQGSESSLAGASSASAANGEDGGEAPSMEDAVMKFNASEIPAGLSAAKGTYSLLGAVWAHADSNLPAPCLCHGAVEMRTEGGEPKILCRSPYAPPGGSVCPDGTALKSEAHLQKALVRDWDRQSEIQKILSGENQIKALSGFSVGQRLFVSSAVHALLLKMRFDGAGAGLRLGHCAVESDFPMKVMGFLPSSGEVLLAYDGVCDELSRYHGESLVLIRADELAEFAIIKASTGSQFPH